jgi:2-oxoglutarate ferredoxin oxidoreductase subunit delta
MSKKDTISEITENLVGDATSSPEAGKEKRSPRAEVVVFDNWCKGCGLCVAFCPRDVLKTNGSGKVHVAEPEMCTGCGWCETHCPDFAIVVRKLDEARNRRQGE